MVDKTIFDLDQASALTAENRFITQDTSAATTSVSSTFALMGGLTPEAVTPTADINGESGKLYVITTTSMTANIDFAVPAGNPGERIGVHCATDEPDWEIVIKGDISVTINGGPSNTEWSRVFINGETVVLLCVATNTWIVERDGRIPCFGYMEEQSNNNGSGYPNNTNTDVPFATTGSEVDVGGMVDFTNDRFNVRRTGNYLLHANTLTPEIFDSGDQLFLLFHVDAVTVVQIRATSAANPARVGVSMSHALNLSAGSNASLVLNHNEGSTITWGTSGATDIDFSIQELL